jgi:autotransporter-associated beta strand protein
MRNARGRRALPVVSLFALVLAAPLSAGTHTWSGASNASSHWTDAANWDTVPAGDGSDDLVFPGVAARKTNSNDFSAGTSFHSISFPGGDGGYVLSGNGITLTSGISDTTTSFTANTLSLPIALGADISIDVAARTVGLTGVVSGAHKITKGGTGTLTLGGVNTYSGGTVANAGFLGMFNPACLGTGTVTVNSGATLTISGAGPVSNALVLNGPGQSNDGALNGSGTWAGAITIASTADVDPGPSGLTLSGAVSGPGTMRASHNTAADLILSGTCTHFATEVDNGNLVLNGTHSGPITLVHGTLAGTGTLSNSVTSTDTGAAISPGATGATGILNVGNVGLTSVATYKVQINGTTAGSGYDQLAVTGSLALGNAQLAVTLGFVPVVGQTYTILANDGSDAVDGTFLNLPQNGYVNVNGRHLRISYAGGTGNDVVLTARYLAGDVNGDGAVDVADVFALINYLFAGAATPGGDLDVNGDLTPNVTDVFYLINYLFAGGAAPK